MSNINSSNIDVCGQINIPTVDNTQIECDTIIDDICVTTKYSIPFLGVIKGMTLDKVLGLISDKFKVIFKLIGKLQIDVDNVAKNGKVLIDVDTNIDSLIVKGNYKFANVTITYGALNTNLNNPLLGFTFYNNVVVLEVDKLIDINGQLFYRQILTSYYDGTSYIRTKVGTTPWKPFRKYSII